MPLQSQQRLHSFTLLEKIGFGGDGEVWRAQDDKGNTVALKAKLNTGNPARFQQEFERLRVLRFPNIVRAHQTGIDNDYIYYTMQLAEGLHFHDYVQAGHTFQDKVSRCFTAIKGIATALSALHQAGIAHLDLKPDNIIVNDEGYALLLDFGRSCSLGDRRLNEGMQATMQYMAPEQRVGLPTSIEADIYSLGVSIYEALTGEPAPRHLIGQPWPSLIFLGPEINLHFAELVSNMLALDPNWRPTAEKVLYVINALENSLPLPPPSYPEPERYIGDATVLQHRSAVVVGSYGSGCTRMINEARREWFVSGYRSISGRCNPIKPFGAVVEVLEALFKPYSPEKCRTIAGEQAAILRAIAPNLPLPSSTTEDWPIEISRLAVAIAQVLNRVKPIAVIFYEVQFADPGTADLLSILHDALPNDVYIWCSSRVQLSWGQHVSPPIWGKYQDQLILQSLMPEDITATNVIEAKKPLESCAAAWLEIARWRNDPPIDIKASTQLANLSLLNQPFPKNIGHSLTTKIEDFIEQGLIEVIKNHDGDPYVQFSSHVHYLLARSTVSTLRHHLLAAQAWQRSRYSEIKDQEASFHRLIVQNDCHSNIYNSIRLALKSDQSLDVQRWLRLYDLSFSTEKSDDFMLAYARAYIALHIRPGRLSTSSFAALSRKAKSKRENQLVDYLGFLQVSKHGSSIHAIERGLELLENTKQDDPRLAAKLFHKIGGVYIRNGQYDMGLNLIRSGLEFLDEAELNDDPSLATQLQILMSAASIYDLKLQEAEHVCIACRDTALIHDLTPNILSASVNLALSYYQQGKRTEARQVVMSSKRYLHQVDMPEHQAYFALIDGILAVDRGDFSFGVLQLDRAISIAQPINASYILSNAYTALLFAAIATASREDAQRAMHGYSTLNIERHEDIWPVALSQWKWFNGDLEGARQSLKQQRTAYEKLRIELEQSKFSLIAGDLEHAAQTANYCRNIAESSGCQEILLLAELIYATATGKNNQSVAELLNALKQSEWLEHYLGGLYINAIRLRLRGEPIEQTLSELYERSTAINHRLYQALGEPSSW